MHFQASTLLTAVLAGTAMAQIREVEVVEVVVRSVTTLKEQPNFIAKRDQSACISIAEQVTKVINTKDLPIPPSSLANDLSSYYKSHTNVCEAPSFTGSLSSEFSSYSKKVSSFYSKYSGAFSTYASSLSSACSDFPAVASKLSALPQVCSTTAGGSSSGSKTAAAASATSSGAADTLARGTVPGLAAVAGVLAYFL